MNRNPARVAFVIENAPTAGIPYATNTTLCANHLADADALLPYEEHPDISEIKELDPIDVFCDRCRTMEPAPEPSPRDATAQAYRKGEREAAWAAAEPVYLAALGPTGSWTMEAHEASKNAWDTARQAYRDEHPDAARYADSVLADAQKRADAAMADAHEAEERAKEAYRHYCSALTEARRARTIMRDCYHAVDDLRY